ncbi:uncharacterized protein [Watersipora subatra]|uniref:uncharacterized protein n=1 Tax=Watersipora subatra TaxID=2589382 RepID=UPI00355B9851
MAANCLTGRFLLRNKHFCKRALSNPSYFLKTQHTFELRHKICTATNSVTKAFTQPQAVQWINIARLCTTADVNTAIRDRVFAAIQQYDKISPKSPELSLDTRFKEDLSMDSLDHVEMITLVEDEFGIEIPDDEMEKLDTPRKIVEYLSRVRLPETDES